MGLVDLVGGCSCVLISKNVCGDRVMIRFKKFPSRIDTNIVKSSGCICKNQVQCITLMHGE